MKFGHFRLGWLILTSFCTFISCASCSAGDSKISSIHIQTYTNYHSSCALYGFVVQNKEVKIAWEVISDSDARLNRKKRLSLRIEPHGASIASNAPLHKTILRTIFQRWPVSDFDYVMLGSLGEKTEWDWSVAIAAASNKSELYRDFRKNYPNSKITGLNGLLTDLANETKAYRRLEELFIDQGARLKVEGVEKVETGKASDLPFYSQLEKIGIPGDARVIYDAGFITLKIIPVKP